MDDKIKKMDTHARYLEDAQGSLLGDEVITDEQLGDAGIVKTTAYVRSKKSKGALRAQKHREKKKAEAGVSQVNVDVPEEHKEAIKEVAKELREGNDQAIKPPSAELQAQIEIAKKVQEIKDNKGFKSWLITLAGL